MQLFSGLAPGDQRMALATELLELNQRTHDRAIELVGPMAPPPDLTMQQLKVLGHIAKQPGITGHELGRLLGVSAPTASGLIERLVEKGLVCRSDDADDRRVRRLSLTDAGGDLLRDMYSQYGRVLEAVLALLSVDDLVLLRQGAHAILDALERALELSRSKEAAG